MKIESNRPYSSTSRKKINKTSPINSSFFINSNNDTSSSEQKNEVNSIGAISSLDALLAVQEINEESFSNQKAFSRGKKILGLLEELKFGLLNGRMASSKLENLIKIVKFEKNRPEDPRLASILDEIELRASVELAKLGK